MPTSPNQAGAGSQCVAQLKIANDLAMAGDMDGAIAHFRAALALNPRNSLVHDDLVYLLNFHPGYDDQDIFRELAIWEEQHARPLANSILPHQNNRDPSRRLKIAYVSPEFCRQAESFFVMPLLATHDHRQFEIHCYSSTDRPDDRTGQMKKLADVWHDVIRLNDAELAAQIRTDQIDILIDLTMHMRLSRMMTFARKPAPVQVTWLAYPGGTGLRTMDYRLTDRFLDPPDSPGWYTEESYRLPDCWVCYDPLSQSALATPRTTGPITFGSLNHPRKINDSNMRLWARIMRRIDGSRIILRVEAQEHRQRAIDIFQQDGISPERLEFISLQPRWEYLRTYDRIDIALDTLPYNGITTTCDAMWMGTPVVTLIGKTTAGRAGIGILSTIGLHDLVAHDPDRFIEIATNLAQDRARLVDFRKNLRRRMQSSPLMDAPRFARHVESAYRSMWHRWCAKPDPQSLEPIPPAALEHHSAARWEGAEAIYRQILQRQPNHPEALHLLGLIAAQTGRAPLALELIARAIAADDRVPGYHSNLGVVLQNMGRLDQAIHAYHRAISLDPAVAEAYNNLGNSLRLKGDRAQAIKTFRRAVELKPDFAQAHGNLGAMLLEESDPDAAIASLRQALELNPALAPIHTNLGTALAEKESLNDAVSCHKKAIVIDPNYAQAYNNLGNVLIRLGRSDEGIAALRRAIELNPNYSVAHYNLGNALRETGRLQEALASYEQAQKLVPDYADAHFNGALTLLALGHFKRGWLEHSWRIRAQPRFLFPIEKMTQPLWDGIELNGRTIFLHAEQGFGDTINFVRYVPMVAARGGRVILGVQSDLASLLEGFPGVQQLITTRAPLPSFDFHCPLLSLPAAFSTDFDSIPNTVPYLLPDPRRVESWKSQIETASDKLKVGLVWSGSPKFAHNHERSIQLQQFAPLAEVNGVEFFSLQKGDASAQLPPDGMKLTDFTNSLDDFSDTSALIANLDLVITVDTAVAHLTGALGKPVWVLLALVPDWRWLLDRNDSPWYPSMRLFRQTSKGDWPPVIRNVAAALATAAQGPKT